MLFRKNEISFRKIELLFCKNEVLFRIDLPIQRQEPTRTYILQKHTYKYYL